MDAQTIEQARIEVRRRKERLLLAALIGIIVVVAQFIIWVLSLVFGSIGSPLEGSLAAYILRLFVMSVLSVFAIALVGLFVWMLIDFLKEVFLGNSKPSERLKNHLRQTLPSLDRAPEPGIVWWNAVKKTAYSSFVMTKGESTQRPVQKWLSERPKPNRALFVSKVNQQNFKEASQDAELEVSIALDLAQKEASEISWDLNEYGYMKIVIRPRITNIIIELVLRVFNQVVGNLPIGWVGTTLSGAITSGIVYNNACVVADFKEYTKQVPPKSYMLDNYDREKLGGMRITRIELRRSEKGGIEKLAARNTIGSEALIAGAKKHFDLRMIKLKQVGQTIDSNSEWIWDWRVHR